MTVHTLCLRVCTCVCLYVHNGMVEHIDGVMDKYFMISFELLCALDCQLCYCCFA
jgi:hypothetical protein